jgi:hypothetical protein
LTETTVETAATVAVLAGDPPSAPGRLKEDGSARQRCGTVFGEQVQGTVRIPGVGDQRFGPRTWFGRDGRIRLQCWHEFSCDARGWEAGADAAFVRHRARYPRCAD